MPKLLSITGFLAMAGGLVGLLAIGSLFSSSPVVIAPQLAAVLLMIWARVTFGRRSFHFAADPTEGGLVTSGPYRFVRHPIYAGVGLFTWAGACSHWSLPAALLAGLVSAGACIRMLCEEKLVLARYPEYRDYAARTHRLVPFVF